MIHRLRFAFQPFSPFDLCICACPCDTNIALLYSATYQCLRNAGYGSFAIPRVRFEFSPFGTFHASNPGSVPTCALV